MNMEERVKELQALLKEAHVKRIEAEKAIEQLKGAIALGTEYIEENASEETEEEVSE